MGVVRKPTPLHAPPTLPLRRPRLGMAPSFRHIVLRAGLRGPSEPIFGPLGVASTIPGGNTAAPGAADGKPQAHSPLANSPEYDYCPVSAARTAGDLLKKSRLRLVGSGNIFRQVAPGRAPNAELRTRE